jgi:two-component system sensor histidine kinase AlgZ
MNSKRAEWERELLELLQSTPSTLRQIMLVVALNSAAALVFPLLMWSIGVSADVASLLRDLAVSFLYSQVVGTLVQFLFCGFWMRASRLKPVWEWIAVTLFFIAVGVAGAFLAESVELVFGWVSLAKFWARFSDVVKVCVVLTVQFGLARRIYMSLRSQLEETALELRETELAEERATQLATAARLAALESKIQPHFLFNALNSISSLIPEDSKRAERLLGRMAALLRFSLDVYPSGLVPLSKETKIVTDYLEIEQSRLGERLRYEVQIPPDLLATEVPPLSIQTLVENSIKHAIAPVRSGGQVLVCAEASDGIVEIRVTDTGPGFLMDNIPPGHGLSNLQARLLHLFGDKAQLSAFTNHGTATIQVTIPRSTANARISG